MIAGQESAILNAESKLSGEDVKKLAEKTDNTLVKKAKKTKEKKYKKAEEEEE